MTADLLRFFHNLCDPLRDSSSTSTKTFLSTFNQQHIANNTMSPTDPQTISEAIGADHKSLDEYADKIRSSTSLEDKTKWRNQLTWTLARHAISEELTMYPAMEKHLGEEGLQLTNTDREQHQAVRTFPIYSPPLNPSLTKPPR